MRMNRKRSKICDERYPCTGHQVSTSLGIVTGYLYIISNWAGTLVSGHLYS